MVLHPVKPDFRQRALEHYRKAQDQIEFPRLVRPAFLHWLWVVLALLLLSILALTRLSVTAYTPALVVLAPPDAPGRALVLVPAVHADFLRVGARVLLDLPTGEQTIELLAIDTRPEVREALSERLAADLSALPAPLGPLVVATILSPPGTGAEARPGSAPQVLLARVEVGERQLGDLLATARSVRGGGFGG